MIFSNLAFCYSLESGSLIPPQSGGQNIRIIIDEYGIYPYPDMDYQSLFSKYSSLGKQCAEDDDSYYCGKGLTCRPGVYDTASRCYFIPCDNSQPPSNCINLQTVFWQDAVTQSDAKESDYLSKSNQYRNKWSGYDFSQKNAYKTHLLSSLPPNPARTYENLKVKASEYINYLNCSDSEQCIEDEDNMYCTEYVNTCVAKICDTGACVEDSDCGDYCLCSEEEKCNVRPDYDALELSKSYCVSTSSLCSDIDETWKSSITEKIASEINFNEQQFLNNYELNKKSSSEYYAVYNNGASPLLKLLQPKPSEQIIPIKARLKQINFIMMAWEQWYGFCKIPQRIEANLVLWSDAAWGSDKEEKLKKYQTITGGNLQINCLTANPVPEIGSTFLQQAKNLNLPGLLDQTKPQLLNNKDINRLSSRGWYDAESIFQYYLSRCDMEKSALLNVLDCFENTPDYGKPSELLGYCNYCTSNLFVSSCAQRIQDVKDIFYYRDAYSGSAIGNVDYTIKQKVFGYKSIDLCINPTLLTNIPANDKINSGSVINVTPQVLPLIDTGQQDPESDSCDPNDDPMCIPCDDCSNKNCGLGYTLVLEEKKAICTKIPEPPSDRKTIFKYLLNWGG